MEITECIDPEIVLFALSRVHNLKAIKIEPASLFFKSSYTLYDLYADLPYLKQFQLTYFSALHSLGCPLFEIPKKLKQLVNTSFNVNSYSLPSLEIFLGIATRIKVLNLHFSQGIHNLKKKEI